MHRAAWWWLFGDRLYDIGLLPVICAVPVAAVGLVTGLLGFGWHWLILAAITFPAGAVVFVFGSSLKGYAYTLAERDGIGSDDIWQRGSATQAPIAEPIGEIDGEGISIHREFQ